MQYAIYRLKDIGGNEHRRFMSSTYSQITGHWPLNPEDYEKIFEGTVSASSITGALETVYAEFTTFPPKDFRYNAMTVGDIVILTDVEKPGAHFCDPLGFTEVPEFYAALTNERS